MKNENLKKAARDWKIILFIFASGLIFLSIFAMRIYLSDRVGGGFWTSFIETSDVSVKTIDNSRLQSDLLILDTRQTNFSELSDTRTELVDPSL